MISLITIDGPAGSGKTSLAELIHNSIAATGVRVLTVHMDDLYSGWDRALSADLTHSLEVILRAFTQGEMLRVPQFDWVKNTFGEPLVVTSPEVLILEGVGSGQRVTRSFAAIKLWLKVPQEIALRRVLERDGEKYREEMIKWQVTEDSHFNVEGTQSAADYQVKSAP